MLRSAATRDTLNNIPALNHANTSAAQQHAPLATHRLPAPLLNSTCRTLPATAASRILFAA